MNASTVHNDVLDFILHKLLPKTLIKYNAPDVFPVIIGGLDVTRCTRGYDSNINDIDIKFIVDTNDYQDNKVYKAHTFRMDFLNELQQLYSELAPANFPKIYISKLFRIYSWRVEFGFLEDDKKHVLIDTSIVISTEPKLSTINLFRYSKDNLLNKITKLNIEYKNNVPYADCDWVYYDTIRMLNTNVLEYNSATKASQKKYYAQKVIKYLAKASAMNVLYLKNKKMKGFFNKVVKLNKQELPDKGINIGILLNEYKRYDGHFTEYKNILKKSEKVVKIIYRFNKTIEFLKTSIPNQIKESKNNTIYVGNESKKEILELIFAHLERDLHDFGHKLVMTKNSIVFDDDYVLIKVQ